MRHLENEKGGEKKTLFFPEFRHRVSDGYFQTAEHTYTRTLWEMYMEFHGCRAELTSSRNQIPVWDEEFIPIMFFQNIRKNLQGKTFLFSSLLAPLFRLHFSVGQICIIVLVFCKTYKNMVLISALSKIQYTVSTIGLFSLNTTLH